jgi:pimeloyl-ACP methyl ester carboxylesterase
MPASEPQSTVVMVRDVATYLECSGTGPPLVYLHGATEWAGYSAAFVHDLERAFHVVQPERRGHGRTPDVPGDLTFAEMTKDTATLIEQLELDKPHVVGFSDGANIALLVALEHPDLVGNVIAIGPNMHVSGYTDDTLAWLATVTPDSWPAEYRQMHQALSPDGSEHWPEFAQKVIEMANREPEIALDRLATITAPTLIVGADNDMVRLEHLIAIHRAIPHSQLSIIPGAGHELTFEHPTLTAEIALRFLKRGDSTAR